MFGPITQIARDPLIMVLLVLAVLSGVVLRGVVQAYLAARLGDESGLRAGFGVPDPLIHFSPLALLLYLLLGLALPRVPPGPVLPGPVLPGPVPPSPVLPGPAPLRSPPPGQRGPARPRSGLRSPAVRLALILLTGPPVLLLAAFALLVLQRLQQLGPQGLDPLGAALGRAAFSLTLHALFLLLPLPLLDVGRLLALAGPAWARRLLAYSRGGGALLTYLAWMLLTLSGLLQSAADPLWRGLGALVALLPF